LRIFAKLNHCSKVGYNIADQFTVHWWEHLYNTTSSKIKPKKNDDAESEAIPKEKVEEKPEPASKGILNRKDYFYSRFQKVNLLFNFQN
jgi:hypothetical protein